MGTAPAMASVLSARFAMKGWAFYEAELPQHTEKVGSFWMDRTEVTNEAFSRFVKANPRWAPGRIDPELHNGKYLSGWNGGQFPQGTSKHPVTYVSWYAAMAYCQWQGGRLPTEAEWEYAARPAHGDGEFPWGDEMPSAGRANYEASHIGHPADVGSYPANARGLYDLSGNVWEYMLDEWRDDYSRPRVLPSEPLSAIKSRRAIRGGSWEGNPVNLRLRFRDSHPPDGAGPHVGFRCVQPVR